MDVTALRDIPPWEWPEGAGKMFLDILRGGRATEADRLLAAELAGDFTVINDELTDVLLSILRSGNEAEKLRGQAAISLGPVLEYADMHGFEEADDIPIAERTFHRIQESLRKLYMDAGVPKGVRRQILEGSVRAPQDWHRGAVRAAYESDDEAASFAGSMSRFSKRWAARIRTFTTRQSVRQAPGGWTPPGHTSPRSWPRGKPTSPCCWQRSRPSRASVREKPQRSSMT